MWNPSDIHVTPMWHTCENSCVSHVISMRLKSDILLCQDIYLIMFVVCSLNTSKLITIIPETIIPKGIGSIAPAFCFEISIVIPAGIRMRQNWPCAALWVLGHRHLVFALRSTSKIYREKSRHKFTLFSDLFRFLIKVRVLYYIFLLKCAKFVE